MSAETEASPCRSQRTPPAVVFKPNCAFRAPRCSAGHELRITICPVGAQFCDSCRRHIMSTYTHRCQACDYDLCRRCFVSGENSLPDITDDVVLVSPDLEHQDGGLDERMPSYSIAEGSRKSEVGVAVGPLPMAWGEPRPPEMNTLSLCLQPSSRPQRKKLQSIGRRNQRLQLVYGDASRRVGISGAWPCGAKKIPPSILAPPSRQSSEVCDFDNLEPIAKEVRVSPQVANCRSSVTDAPDAASTFAAMGLPPSEQWRAKCATKVAVAVGKSDRANSPRPAPRSAALRMRHGRRRRAGAVEIGILRPCVDDLQGCFGRSRWEFD